MEYDYSDVCREYRNNPNPITKGCYIITESDKKRAFWSSSRYRPDGFDFINDVFGDFYHIDPTSIKSYEHLQERKEYIFFKAKSRIEPYLTECLNHWIDTLTA